MLQKNLKKITQLWKRDGLSLAEPFSAEEIVAGFNKLGVIFSKDVVEVFSSIGGFAEEDLDSECMTFWTIEKIFKENIENSAYIFFADYLIESHRYAFKYANADISSIYVCYSETDRTKVADSFAEFFELYLTKTEKLFI